MYVSNGLAYRGTERAGGGRRGQEQGDIYIYIYI
jgi:hypothetical protein